jgi:ABC-type Zn uptake system ZnuABC Zn-binding protein ZnuA
VGRIGSALRAAGPAAAGRIEARAAAYRRRVLALDRAIRRCVDAVPAARRKLVTDHDAFGAFAAAYGIEVIGALIPARTTEAQPSAGDLSELAALIRRERVPAVFPASAVEPRLARALARQTGAAVGRELFADTLGPPDGSGATYLGSEAHNADAIVRGLTGGRRGCPTAGA